jgi:hypothetical protein
MSLSRQDAARSYAKSLTDDHLRSFAFANDQERLDAKMIAELYQLGHVKAASDVLEVVGNWPRMLPLVVNELRGKRTKSDFATSSLNIIRAYIAARALDPAPVTLHKVKTEYARLFVKAKRPREKSVRAWLASLEGCNQIPRHKSFRQVLKRYGGAIRKDRRGRPRK